MVVESRVCKMRVTPAHPDFYVVESQSWEARRLYNTLNFVARCVYNQRSYNREHNKTIKDKRKHVNFHTYLKPLYTDSRLVKLGVVGWLKSHRKVSFRYSHDFASLSKIIVQALAVRLNAKVVQNIGMKLAQAWNSHRALTQKYWENPSKAGFGKPSPPGYKQRYGYVEYNKQTIKGGQTTKTKQTGITTVVPTGWNVGFRLPKGLTLADVTSCRLIPLHDKAFTLEILYKTATTSPTATVPENPETTVETDDIAEMVETVNTSNTDTTATGGGLIAAVDLGVNVLAAIVFSDGRTPLLVNGRPLKSINQQANKLNGKLRGKHDVERRNIYKKLVRDAVWREVETPKYPYPIHSQTLDRLWCKRNDRVDLYCHTASRRIVDTFVSAGVTEVIIGWSKGFKTCMNMGKVNNQSFAMIPLARLRDQIVYKCEEKGIRVRVEEESYTSKASFLDNDYIPTWGTDDMVGWVPSGKRVKRGLYQSATGVVLHADVNAAYNLLAKHAVRVDRNLVVSDGGVVVHPVWLEMPSLKPQASTTNPTKPANQT